MSTDRKTTISEKLTTPLGRGLSSAASTALVLGAAQKALGTQRAAKLLAGMGGAPQITGKQVAGASIGSGLLSGVMADFDRNIYARHILDKLKRDGRGFTGSEKNLLGPGYSPGGAERGSKSLSEHYFNPASMGAFRGVVGGLFGGLSPLAFAEGAAAGSGGTALNKAVLSRALKSRIDRGDYGSLLPTEKRLARALAMRGGNA